MQDAADQLAKHIAQLQISASLAPIRSSVGTFTADTGAMVLYNSQLPGSVASGGAGTTTFNRSQSPGGLTPGGKVEPAQQGTGRSNALATTRGGRGYAAIARSIVGQPIVNTSIGSVIGPGPSQIDTHPFEEIVSRHKGESSPYTSHVFYLNHWRKISGQKYTVVCTRPNALAAFEKEWDYAAAYFMLRIRTVSRGSQFGGGLEIYIEPSASHGSNEITITAEVTDSLKQLTEAVLKWSQTHMHGSENAVPFGMFFEEWRKEQGLPFFWPNELQRPGIKWSPGVCKHYGVEKCENPWR